MIKTITVVIITNLFLTDLPAQIVRHLTDINEPKGQLTPKSIVHNGKGIFAAQNMMYNHSICFYDRSFDLIKEMEDKVRLSDYGFCDMDHWYKGAPVECTFSADGRYAYISNYKLYGQGFKSDADDNCIMGNPHEAGYVYVVDMSNYEIVDVFEVGSVPKYVYYIEDYQWLAVSNWCSGTVSLIDLSTGIERKQIRVGKYPRGIACYNNKLLVSVMGEEEVAVIDLRTDKLEKKLKVGAGPRDLHVDPARGLLYISLNNENALITYDLKQEVQLTKRYLGALPRSMALSKDGQWLFVCLYGEHQVAVLYAPEGRLMQKLASCYKPIGIEYDDDKKQLWVACYGGEISVYQVDTAKAAKMLRHDIVSQEDEITKKEDIERVSKHSKPNNAPSGEVAIVCGSFREKKNAEKRRESLKSIGVVAKIQGDGAFYRVFVPSSEGQAEEKKNELEALLEYNLWIRKL